jgi:hypothetical protein
MILEMPRGGKRPGAGRPKKPASEKLGDSTLLRHTTAQGSRWHRAARAKELDLSTWMRQVLDAAAASR